MKKLMFIYAGTTVALLMWAYVLGYQTKFYITDKEVVRKVQNWEAVSYVALELCGDTKEWGLAMEEKGRFEVACWGQNITH